MSVDGLDGLGQDRRLYWVVLASKFRSQPGRSQVSSRLRCRRGFCREGVQARPNREYESILTCIGAQQNRTHQWPNVAERRVGWRTPYVHVWGTIYNLPVIQWNWKRFPYKTKSPKSSETAIKFLAQSFFISLFEKSDKSRQSCLNSVLRLSIWNGSSTHVSYLFLGKLGLQS